MSDGSFRVPVQGLPAVTLRPRVTAKPLFPTRFRAPGPPNAVMVELRESSPRGQRAVVPASASGAGDGLGMMPVADCEPSGSMPPLNVVQFSPSYRCLQGTAPPVRAQFSWWLFSVFFGESVPLPPYSISVCSSVCRRGVQLAV
jgi:hypothetical protein